MILANSVQGQWVFTVAEWLHHCISDATCWREFKSLFLARLFSKKTSRYCHSPGGGIVGVMQKLRHFCRTCFSKVGYGTGFRSISPSFRPQFTSTLAFKSIQMTYSLKPLDPWILNFICSMIRLQGFRIVKFSLVENSRWPQLVKIAKLLISSFSPEWLGIFGRNFVWSISRTLMLIGIKMKKICSGSRSQWLFENVRRPGHLSPFLQNG